MSSQEFQSLIAATAAAFAKAGARGVIIVIDGDPSHVRSDNHALSVLPHSEVAEASPSPRSPAAASVAERLQGVTAGISGPLPLTEWARVISARWLQSVSARELGRAVAANALDAVAKGDGRDHRIRLASPESVRRYLSLCHGVQQGDQLPPEWWHNVRKGQNGSIG
jgi:hypothetical protein